MKTAVNLCVGNSFMGNLKFWYKDMSEIRLGQPFCGLKRLMELKASFKGT